MVDNSSKILASEAKANTTMVRKNNNKHLPLILKYVKCI